LISDNKEKNVVSYYIYVTVDTFNCTVFSTSPAVIKWVLEDVKKAAPFATKIRGAMNDFSGKMCRFELHWLKDKDTEVALWIVRRLCEVGFEPFQVTQHISPKPNNVIHFRKLAKKTTQSQS
jgi:hypothetical protein